MGTDPARPPISHRQVHRLARVADWKERPELDSVAAWWRDGGRGVCLVAGGDMSGRTSLISRFLSASAPTTVFTFSFLHVHNAGWLFEELARWLGAPPPTPGRRATSAEARAALAAAPPRTIIVLDALERLADEAAPPAAPFDQVMTSPGVLDLISDVASGRLANVGLLATWDRPCDPPRGVDPRLWRSIVLADSLDLPAVSVKSEDSLAWDLLERACLFRLGVTADIIVSLFSGPSRASIAGRRLSAAAPETIEGELRGLVRRGLLESYGSGRYFARPAVRRAVRSMQKGEWVAAAHRAIREALETLPGGRPTVDRERPSDPSALDLQEEILHHRIAEGHWREAFQHYWFRLGEFSQLGETLNDAERGERMCRALLSAAPDSSVEDASGFLEAARRALKNDLALYDEALGRLEKAETGLRICSDEYRAAGELRAGAIAQIQRADVLLRLERIGDARDLAESAVSAAELLSDDELRRTAFALRGHVRSRAGDTAGAEDDFQAALAIQNRLDESAEPLYGTRGLWRAEHLLRTNRPAEASDVARRNREICEESLGPTHPVVARCFMQEAECERALGSPEKAAERLSRARAIFASRGVVELDRSGA